jgi:hypothetical protein
MLVLIELFVVIHARLAVLIDQSEFELVEMIGAKAKFAGGILAAALFAHARASFWLLFVAHGFSP